MRTQTAKHGETEGAGSRRKAVVPLDICEEESRQQPEVHTRRTEETEYVQPYESEEEKTQAIWEEREETEEEEMEIRLIGCRVIGMGDNDRGMAVTEQLRGNYAIVATWNVDTVWRYEHWCPCGHRLEEDARYCTEYGQRTTMATGMEHRGCKKEEEETQRCRVLHKIAMHVRRKRGAGRMCLHVHQ